jgi:hypothetical protein
MSRIKGHLSYANLTSTLALILALGSGGAYAANQLATRSVGERQLRPGAVTPDKIRKNAVTAPKIKAEAVKEGKLAAAAVSSAKLADGAIATAKLANSSVSTEKLAPEAVTGEKVNEGTLGQVPAANAANTAAFAESANPAAFAKVAKDGNIDAVNSKGIASSSEVEAGVYCLSVAGFSPRGAQVTPIFNGIGTSDAFVRIGGAAACPSPQVEVQVWNGGTKVEAPFYLAAYR